MSTTEPPFPLEILQKIVEAADDDYETQAKMCLLSRALFNFTQPRLYRSFDSDKSPSPQSVDLFFSSLSCNQPLAGLVHSFSFTVREIPMPRGISAALLQMPNLKSLTLASEHSTTSSFDDIWRDLFQTQQTHLFQLERFRVRLPNYSDGFIESMSLSSFLGRQKTIHTFHCSRQVLLINPKTLPNLRRTVIRPSNWTRVLPGRPLESLSLEASLRDYSSIKAAEQDIKDKISLDTRIRTTLEGLKRLRMDADFMEKCNFSSYLRSLEFLIVSNFSETRHRGLAVVLPKLRIFCVLCFEGSAETRKALAAWLFANASSLTDVVYSAPQKTSHCERYRRGTNRPEIMNRAPDYQELVGYEY